MARRVRAPVPRVAPAARRGLGAPNSLDRDPRGRRRRPRPRRRDRPHRAATAPTTPTPSSPGTTRRGAALPRRRSIWRSSLHDASTQLADGGEFGIGVDRHRHRPHARARNPGRRRAALLVQVAAHGRGQTRLVSTWRRCPPPHAPGLFQHHLFGRVLPTVSERHRMATTALRRSSSSRRHRVQLVSPGNPKVKE